MSVSIRVRPIMAADDDHSTLARIIGERREKAAQLRTSGRDPYRNDFRPSHPIAEVRARYEGTPKPEGKEIVPIDGEVVRVAGRCLARRGMGKTVFAPIRDGSVGIDRSTDVSRNIQLYLSIDHLDPADFNEVLPLLDIGDLVGAEGKVFWTKRGELSILVTRFWILAKSLRPLPDKWHGMTDVELRYRQRYLDLAVSPEVQEVFRKRTQIVRGLRHFLDARGFVEVETPMMHTVVGGAAARPFVTHHNALDMQLYMRIAPELYLKRLLVGGFDRVYEINRNFRNEGLSRKHNPEFTMLEFYQAYATYHDLMDLTEEMIAGLARDVNGRTTTTWDGAELELAPPWRRITVKQAVAELGGVTDGALFEDPVRAAELATGAGCDPRDVLTALLEGVPPGEAPDDVGDAWKDPTRRPEVARRLVERYPPGSEARIRAGHIGYLVFEATAEDKLVQPTFLTEFPLAVSPLARKKDGDDALCDRFELFVAGKEIANAFSELNDPTDQRERFQAQLRARAAGAGETMDYDEDYCRALEIGMPPAAGEGVGVDRLTMMLTGQSSIRDVILFPLMRPE
jgi:lysyl-tRNA synthetase class 2